MSGTYLTSGDDSQAFFNAIFSDEAASTGGCSPLAGMVGEEPLSGGVCADERVPLSPGVVPLVAASVASAIVTPPQLPLLGASSAVSSNADLYPLFDAQLVLGAAASPLLVAGAATTTTSSSSSLSSPLPAGSSDEEERVDDSDDADFGGAAAAKRKRAAPVRSGAAAVVSPSGATGKAARASSSDKKSAATAATTTTRRRSAPAAAAQARAAAAAAAAAASSADGGGAGADAMALDDLQVGDTAVSLTREQLLSMSSADLEAWVLQVKQRLARTLSGEEEKELKRQRRLIKNRESAQASRQRKKAHVEELEAEIAGLKREKDELRDELTSLGAENRSLRREVGHLQEVLQRSGLMTTLWDNLTSIRKSGGDLDQLPANVKAAGVCLLIVLFSFGMFFSGPVSSADQLGPSLPILRAFHDAALPRSLQTGRIVAAADATAATTTTTTSTAAAAAAAAAAASSATPSRRLLAIEGAATTTTSSAWQRSANATVAAGEPTFVLTCGRAAPTGDSATAVVLPYALLQQQGLSAAFDAAANTADLPLTCHVVDVAFAPAPLELHA